MREYIKLFSESLANKSFPDINLVVAFKTLFFLTAKDLMVADSVSLNSVIIFVFLGLVQVEIFWSMV